MPTSLVPTATTPNCIHYCMWGKLHIHVLIWSRAPVCCDACSVWFHKICVSMDTEVYDNIASRSWECYACGPHYCSSFLYHAYNINTSNSFEPLAGIPGDDSVFVNSVCSPSSVHEQLAHSSPHPTQSTNTYSASSSTNGRSHSASSRPPASASNLRVAVLNANSVKGKCAELAALCDTTNPDIIIIAETKIDSSVSISEFLPKSHTAFRKGRTYHGGGVLVAIRNTFTAEEVCIECESKEFICVKVTLRNLNPLYVAAFYRPPQDPADNLDGLEKTFNHLMDISNHNTKATFLVRGYFNAGDIDWDSLAVKPSSDQKGISKRIISLLCDAHLTQLQWEPTRQGKVLELLCTSKPSLLKSIETIPGISDHDGIIMADFYLSAQINKIPPPPPPPQDPALVPIELGSHARRGKGLQWQYPGRNRTLQRGTELGKTRVPYQEHHKGARPYEVCHRPLPPTLAVAIAEEDG